MKSLTPQQKFFLLLPVQILGIPACMYSMSSFAWIARFGKAASYLDPISPGPGQVLMVVGITMSLVAACAILLTCYSIWRDVEELFTLERVCESMVKFRHETAATFIRLLSTRPR